MPSANSRSTPIPLYLTIGDSFSWSALYQSQASSFVAPVAVDLTGYTVEFVVKNSAGTVIFNWTSSNGHVALNAGAVTGMIAVTASPSDTASATAGSYVYYLRVTDGAGVKTTLIAQPFKIAAGI